ncbi:RpiB/LacA/LacB family sugar-phosphate isomerase [candidate division WWE3 bacterium]|uniref:RpiB/LacA/LacB family sugar-phosphate isomerase n=1 Tax=candidate division WWE3 bacterium TaxID=2053526 RepID=A0A955LGH0_UNCKA|nr:RpiB/LacA/LacB family sugar-phosphate isomerase [candidate division WWE3 bacterium]
MYVYNEYNVVYLGADHRGFSLKEELKKYLDQKGYEYRDLGNVEYDPDDDYPDFVFPVANQVADGESDHRGIVICGSGVGACVAANKIKGVRAGLVMSPEQAVKAREDDDVNILCLSADFEAREAVYEVVEAFLNTDFSNAARHIRRLEKIANREEVVG